MTSSATPLPTDAATPHPKRIEIWCLAAITAAFVALVALWAVLTPLYDAPDEPQHLNSSIRLALGGGWPDAGDAEVASAIIAAKSEATIPALDRHTFAELYAENPGTDGVDQMTQHPPLYYAYVAAVLNAVDFMHLRADIALLAARLAGLLFVLPLPFFVWDAVRRVTRSPRAALVGAAALLGVPQLAHILGAVSNDGATTVFSSAAVWLCIRVMTGDRSWWTSIGLGVALALALLTKGTSLPLVLFAGVVMLLWPRERTWPQRIAHVSATMAVGLTGGWWWVRNLLVHGSLQPHGLPRESAPWPAGTGPDVIEFSEYLWARLTRSFWGNFGWLTHPLPSWITDVLSVVCLAVIVFFAFRRGAQRKLAFALGGLLILNLVALLYTIWPVYVRTTLPAGMQGRYFYVIIVALIVLSAIAWRNLVAAHERTRTCVGLLIVFATTAVAGLYFEFDATYSGAYDLLLRSPIGTIGTLAVILLAAATCLAAFVLVLREVRRGASSQVIGADPALA